MHLFLKKLQNRLIKRSQTTPYFVIGLCEFPKSGITMFKYGLSQMVLRTGSKPTHVTWFNQNLLIPDVHLPGASNPCPFGSPIELKFIKSHDPNQLQYNSIILLKRDPFDLMISWYEYSKQHFKYQSNFESFLKSRNGLKKYEKYMRSFHDHAAPWQRIIVVYYEQLVSDPKSTYQKVTRHLGLEVSDEIIDDLVRVTERDNMISDEQLYKRDCASSTEIFVKKTSRTRSIYWEQVDQKLLEKTFRLKETFYDKT